MSIPQVGQGAFAVVPTFKGFRRAVTAESDASAKAADTGFRKAFSKTGTESGKSTGQGFKKAFEGASTGFSSKASSELERAVSKSAAAVSAARLKEQDAAGKVRLAERQLAEARDKYADDSSQVIRAEERLASAARGLQGAQDTTKRSTDDLRLSQSRLAEAADRAGDQLAESGRSGARKFASGFSDVFKGSFFGSLLGNVASDLTSRIGYAIGAGIRNAVEFGLGTIDIASDLNESVNAVRVSYGDIADAILGMGGDSAKTFGLSKRDLNSYAVQFSAFTKGIAGEGGDIAGTFKSILGRATDFASVMNLEVSDSLGLFQSGLAGETEPLRRYGIDLSAAAVEAYALAHGIGDGTDELTEAQKQQARYGALLEQTSAVQGDFANTSDELANKNRINAATWDDLQAKIGEGFLPIASAVATILSDDVFPVISELIDEYGPDMAKAFEEVLPSLRDLAEDLLPKLPKFFEDVAKYVPIIIDGIATFGPGFIEIFGKFALGAQQISDFFEGVGTGFGGFKEKLDLGRDQIFGFFGDVGERFSIGGQQIHDFFDGVFGWFQTMSDKLALGQEQIGGFFGTVTDKFTLGGQQISDFAGVVGTKIGEVLGFVGSLPGEIGALFEGVGTWLYESGQSLIGGFIGGIKSMLTPVGDAVSNVLTFVQGFFPHSPALRGPYAGSGWTDLPKSGRSIIEQWQSGMRSDDIRVAASLSAAVAPAGILASASGSGGVLAPGDRIIVEIEGQPLTGVVKRQLTSYDRDQRDTDTRGYRGGV